MANRKPIKLYDPPPRSQEWIRAVLRAAVEQQHYKPSSLSSAQIADLHARALLAWVISAADVKEHDPELLARIDALRYPPKGDP